MTRYYVRYRPLHGDAEHFTAFDSLSARVIWILANALQIRVLSEWEQHDPEPDELRRTIDRMEQELPAVYARIASERERR